jgi:cytochrome c556
LCFTASHAAEDEVDVAAVVEGRQSNLRDLGAAFKGMTDELKRSSPTAPLLLQYARQIDDLSKQQHFWFPPGTGPQPDIDTKAKAEIWAKPAQFAEAQKNFEREAAKLLQVSSANDMTAIRTQHRTVAKTCEGCHREFREKED